LNIRAEKLAANERAKHQKSVRSFARPRRKKIMNWQNKIVSDKNVLLGKPTIKGTRLSVEFIIERLASGWTQEQLLENYPRLKREDLQAVFAYIYGCPAENL
jgi:uncharacterized protein (DUF433 family)